MKNQTTKNSERTNVLIFESKEIADNTLKIAVPELPYNFIKVGNTAQLSQALKNNEIALLIVNVESEIKSAISTIRTFKSYNSDSNILVIADSIDQSNVTEFTNAGASDCLTRPVASSLLMSKMRHLCELAKTKKELMMLKQQVAMSYAFDNFIGASAEIQKIKRTIQNVINNDFPVILSGEDGTGKNLLAKIIHYHSTRRNAPIAEIDCSAATSTQIESELLGPNEPSLEKGLQGTLFRRGATGTVFIDKLHQVDSQVYTKLQPLLTRGGSKTGAITCGETNFRLMISINESLYSLYQKGVIDRKLADSLSAIEIHLPPLCERTGDVELLAGYFLRMIAFENDSAPLSITPAAIEMLKTHHWPGNVRELENCLRRAAVLGTNNVVGISDVNFISDKIEPNRMAGFIKDAVTGTKSLAENQRHLISNALASNDWNFTQTAKQLGIGRTTLWRKVRKFKLARE